jgi:hypothetical protein
MLGGDITDSDGVPLTNYTVLPLDRGDVFTMGKFFISMWIDPIWTGHLGLVSWMIWFCNWLLSFEWVDIVAAPFGALADLLQDFLGEIAWIPFALTIAGGVAGLAIMLGRHSTGWAELFISACCAVLATGLLANPIASLTAAGGAFDTAQEYGGQIAAVVVTDDINSTELDSENLLSAAVTSQLVDIFVKIPAQTIAFGHALEGQCAATFTDTMTNSAPIQTGGNEVRDAVGGCDEAAKTFNQNPNFGQVLTAVTMTPGALTLFILPMAFGVLFLVTVLGFLISALKTMWNVYIGILPVNRYPLWKSLADTFMGLVAIVFMAVVMAAVLKLTVAAITGLSSLGIPLVAQMTFATLVMIVLLFLIIRARRIAKKTGRSIAEQLSKYGIGKGAPAQRDGVKTVAAMSAVSTVAAAALRRPDNKVDARSINFGAGAAQDIGTMTATRPPAAPKPPSTPSGGSDGLWGRRWRGCCRQGLEDRGPGLHGRADRQGCRSGRCGRRRRRRGARGRWPSREQGSVEGCLRGRGRREQAASCGRPEGGLDGRRPGPGAHAHPGRSSTDRRRLLGHGTHRTAPLVRCRRHLVPAGARASLSAQR